MIYRRPSFGKPQFVLSVVAASTAALFVGSACDDTMVPPDEPEQGDASANVSSGGVGGSIGGSISGSASGGVGGSIGGFVAGSSSSGVSGFVDGSSSSGGCFTDSSTGCKLIVDAANDAIENLDTGPDKEAAAGDGQSDATPEASEQ